MMENFGAKMMSKFFRPVNNVVWDLMSGRIGVKTNEGIITLEGAGDEAQVVQNLFDEFGMALPAFAQNTPVDQIKEGGIWLVQQVAVSQVQAGQFRRFEGVLALAHFERSGDGDDDLRLARVLSGALPGR